MESRVFVGSLLILVSLGSLNCFAKDFLTPAEKKAALASFDDQSSDNIDEGDCIANYKDMTCNEQYKQCTVFWRFDECYEKSEVTPAGLTYTCTIKKVASYKDIQDRGFEQVMDCIQSTVTN